MNFCHIFDDLQHFMKFIINYAGLADFNPKLNFDNLSLIVTLASS